MDDSITFSIGGKRVPSYTVLIDKQDAHLLDSMRCTPDRRKSTTYVLCYTVGHTGPRKPIRLQNLIMQPPPGKEVDHKNHNGLDNRRENLRVATRQQQMWNTRTHHDTASGFKGVLYRHDLAPGNVRNTRRLWMAYIRMNGKRQSLGHYEDPESAARAHDAAARELHGEFAYLNFPDDGS